MPEAFVQSQKSRREGKFQLGLAIVDQMVVSGASLVAVVLLGRVAGAEAIGLYTLTFSIVMVLVTVEQALVITPYTIFSHRADDSQRRIMRGVALQQTLIYTCGATAVAGMIGCLTMWIADQQDHHLLMVACGAIAAGIFKEYARMMAMAEMKFLDALRWDSISAGLQFSILGGLIYTAQLTAVSALGALAISNAVVGVLSLALSRHERTYDLRRTVEETRRNWRLGTWIMFSQIAQTAQTYVMHWILAFTSGLTAAGVFGACWSVVQLVGPFVRGIGNAYEPRVARAFGERGIQGARQIADQATWLIMSGMAAYLIVMSLLGGQLAIWFYGQAYAGNHALVLLLSMGLAAFSIGIGASKGLAVIERPHLNFALNGLGVLVTALVTLGLVQSWGILAAACGYCAGGILVTTARILFFQRAARSLSLTAEVVP